MQVQCHQVRDMQLEEQSSFDSSSNTAALCRVVALDHGACKVVLNNLHCAAKADSLAESDVILLYCKTEPHCVAAQWCRAD